MFIEKIEVNGYKNISSVKLDFDKNLNIFYGENAQGKTNLIESIWLCSGCRSFRAAKEKDFIGFDENYADIKVWFKNSKRTQDINIQFKREKKDKIIALNGVKLNSMSALFGQFKCVVFSPDDLEIAKGAPDRRRYFIDFSISQIKPSYLNALNTYNNVLAQRNAYIKSAVCEHSPNLSIIDIWDEQLSKAGAYISLLRHTYSNNLNDYTNVLYNNITNGRENLNLYYKSTIFDDILGNKNSQGELYRIYLSKLKKSIKNDLRMGFTTVGVHRDDFTAEINKLPVREYGSQGQARSVALSLKLAAAKILFDESGDSPVLLLDDVLSELDTARQGFILNNISDMQTIITCCDKKLFGDNIKGNIFKVNDGKILTNT